MAIFFALIALVGWGAGDIFVAKVARKIGSRMTLFWWMMTSLLLSSLYLPFAGAIRDYQMFLGAIILNIFGVLGVWWYFRAFEISNVSLVGTISGAYPILVVPLSVIFFAEKLTQIQIVAIISIIIGLILATLHWEEVKNRDFIRLIDDKGIRLAFLTLINWGIYWTLMRIPVERLGWYWSLFPFYILAPFLPLLGIVKNVSLAVFKNKRYILMVFLMGGLTAMANFSFNLGITYGYTSIVAPVSGAYPVLFVILSRFVFRERLSRQQKVGIGFALAGIVLIGISSV